MNPGKTELLKYRFKRAEETLEEAKIMLGTNHLFGASNRIYYACFYAVSALLLTKDLTSHKHSGTIALFNKHFIKENILPVKYGKFYSRMFDKRQQSDYGDVIKIDKEQIIEDFDLASELLQHIRKTLDSSY